MSNRRFFLFPLLLLASLGCASTNAMQERTVLRAALYPWIPNAQSYLNWVEKDFESKHPKVDLVLRAVERANTTDFSYDLDAAADALGGKGDEPQDMIEIDTMILGSLVDRGVLEVARLPKAEFLNSALTAVRVGTKTYGVPHWTCGYFVIARDRRITSKATGAKALIDTLAQLGTARVDLVGDLDGSWDSIMIYLDAVRDSAPASDLAKVVGRDELHPDAARSLSLFQSACQGTNGNRCSQDGVDVFTSGDADALIGYSERANSVLVKGTVKATDLYIASMPFGRGDAPTLFTDALVTSRACTGECKKSADAFAAYLVSDATFEHSLMSDDVGSNQVPRYLLPSTSSAFRYGRLSRDPIYRQLSTEIKGAGSFPNRGVPEARGRGIIRQKLKVLLGLQ